MSSDNKMKGLLKGLRFISQIFDNNEKQPEIQIGHPTDVRHVAHIGWDGPTENSPSWMDEFKSVPGLSSSAPLNMNGDIHGQKQDNSVQWVSSDSMGRGSRSMNSQDQEDTPGLPLPKSSKHHQSNSSGNFRESHAKAKSDRPRQPKRHSKHSTPNDSFNESKSTIEQHIPISMDTDSLQLQGNNDLPPKIQQDNPKRTYSKKTKDVQGVGGSSKSRSKAQPREPNSNEESHSRSSSKSKELNSNEGSHSRSTSKSKDPNSNEEYHSRSSYKSRDPNSQEASHSRSGSKHRDPISKEGPHSRSSSKSKDPNSNEGHPSRSNSKSRDKHRPREEDGQFERGSNEDILRNYPN